MFDKLHTKEKIEKICNEICDFIQIPHINGIDKLSEDLIKENLKGLYHPLRIMIFLKDLTDLHTALHELVHHIQFMKYYDRYSSPHDVTFTLAENRIRTFFRKKFGINYKNGFLR